MRRELKGSMAFDASVLLELLLSTPGGALVRDKLLSGELFGYATELAVVEARYVLCRKMGWEEAVRRVNQLVASGYVAVVDISPLCEEAAKYKCGMAIALPDCFTLSLAKSLHVPALFARRERELVRELSRKRLSVEVLFLEDYVRNG
ncbi:MAG: hypothetical protein DRJ57_05695 [Thermoprotei archaeon]|nr:MAG: hypothetical protein DRJ57_05695 [Thermoprotei archaeon]